jgi:uncharacterized membrane protein
MTVPENLEHPIETRVDAERVVFFTDAIVAIAITLLVLPLIESIPEASAHGLTTGAWLSEHSTGLLAFVVSFAIVSYQWVSHRRLFAPLAAVTQGMLWLDIAWAFTIVFLQLPSAMIYALATDRWSVVLYIGTLTTTQGLVAVMSWRVGAHPELLAPGLRSTINIRMHLAVTALFLGALLVAAVSPAVGFSSLFLLWLVPVVRRIPWVARGVSRAQGADSPS